MSKYNPIARGSYKNRDRRSRKVFPKSSSKIDPEKEFRNKQMANLRAAIKALTETDWHIANVVNSIFLGLTMESYTPSDQEKGQKIIEELCSMVMFPSAVTALAPIIENKASLELCVELWLQVSPRLPTDSFPKIKQPAAVSAIELRNIAATPYVLGVTPPAPPPRYSNSVGKVVTAATVGGIATMIAGPFAGVAAATLSVLDPVESLPDSSQKKPRNIREKIKIKEIKDKLKTTLNNIGGHLAFIPSIEVPVVARGEEVVRESVYNNIFSHTMILNGMYENAVKFLELNPDFKDEIISAQDSSGVTTLSLALLIRAPFEVVSKFINKKSLITDSKQNKIFPLGNAIMWSADKRIIELICGELKKLPLFQLREIY